VVLAIKDLKEGAGMDHVVSATSAMPSFV
jgi:hypothetical protein